MVPILPFDLRWLLLDTEYDLAIDIVLGILELLRWVPLESDHLV